MAFWQENYNWEERQAALNKRFKQFRMPVNGIDLHFAHHRSEDPHAVPLLLIHGWPGSFVEFVDILPLLNNPGEHCMLAPVVQRLRARVLVVMEGSSRAGILLAGMACVLLRFIFTASCLRLLSWSTTVAALLASAQEPTNTCRPWQAGLPCRDPLPPRLWIL